MTFITKLSLCLVLVSGLAHSTGTNVPANTYTFNDNDTIQLTLSSLNLNRLVVKDDRIVSFSCPVGFCTTNGVKTDKSGSITLKVNIPMPFTAHVGTAKGRNFTLFITPKRTPAVVSEFVSIQSPLDQKSVFDDKTFDYPQQLALFVRSMIIWSQTKQAIKGFSIHHVDPKTLPKDESDLAIIPQTVFSSRKYSGIIYLVRNQSSKAMDLTNSQFYSFSARAASVDEKHLEPNEETYLYLVTGGGVDYEPAY